MPQEPKVFISHASEDKQRFVVAFAERLRQSGVDAWLDQLEMRPGDSLVDKIFEEGLAQAQAVIVVISAASVKKLWVREELNLAVVKRIGKGLKLIPAKHHRWRMDGAQVAQYGLGARLDPTREWWEDFEIVRREVHFWCPLDWLTVSVLICEDLARPDPATDAVRSVGPNLLISLLLDGPQLAQRWSDRYATVLADDPGSSVLTLTSIGMTQLCRPEGKPASRVIGLWKDASSGVREILLPEGHEALVLVLKREQTHEWTADGREDKGSADQVLWAGVHAVRLGR